MKILVTAVLFVLLAAAGTAHTAGEIPGQKAPDIGAIMEQQLSELDTLALDEVLAELQAEYAGYIPEISLRRLIGDLRAGIIVDPRELLNSLLRYAFREVVAQSGLLARLVVLAVLCALMQKMQDSFGGGVGQVAYAVCFVVLMGIVLTSFSLTVRTVSDAVQTLLTLLYALMPVLLTLLLSMGAAVSAALLHPLLAAAATTVSAIVVNTVLPLMYFSGLLSFISAFSDKLSVSKLASLLRQLGVAVMGVAFAVFIGLTVVQGTAAGVADGITLRTVKYAVKNFIPVVGGLFADVVETVAGASLLLKNGIGLVGLLAVFFLCALPAINVMVTVFIYRLAAAIIQPLGAKPVAQALDSLADVLVVVGGGLITVGIMLFILITIVIGTGNAVLAIR
jgi:stage III sporulation protein AE